MEKELLLTCTGLWVTAETEPPQYVTISRTDGGLLRVLPGEIRLLVGALCSASALLAESVAAAGVQDGGSDG